MEMGSSSKIASGVLWSTIVNVVNGIYGFISVPILINYFGKAEYGLIGLAMSINVYLRLMDLGFNTTNLRFYSNWLAKGETEKSKRLFQSSLAFYGSIGLLNAFILWLVSLFSLQIFHLEQEQDVILKQLIYILMASAFVGWFSSCFEQLIKATENVAWCQRMLLLGKVLQILVLFVTVYFKLNIIVYFLLTTFALFVVIPFSVSKIHLEVPFISFCPKIYWPVLKETLPYCLNVFSFGIFQFSFYNLRPVFLGMQGTIESVADYRILNGIAAIVSMFGGAFMGALLPSTSKAVAHDNRDAYYRVAYEGTKYISIVSSFCCFGMISVCNEILTLYVGISYLYLAPWLCLWLLCTLGTHNQAISSLILSGADVRAITYNTAFSAITGLILSWFLIPYYQIGGIVIGFLIYVVVQLAFYYIYYWPKKMQIDSLRVLKNSFFPCVLVGVLAFLGSRYGIDIVYQFQISWMALLCKGFVFFILYCGMIYFMVLNNKDKQFFKNLIIKNARR